MPINSPSGNGSGDLLCFDLPMTSFPVLGWRSLFGRDWYDQFNDAIIKFLRANL